MHDLRHNCSAYVSAWRNRGYTEDIPDEVPEVLAMHQLAPSYKALAVAILRNDHGLLSLGRSAPKSCYYNALKKIELSARSKQNPKAPEQLPLPFPEVD